MTPLSYISNNEYYYSDWRYQKVVLEIVKAKRNSLSDQDYKALINYLNHVYDFSYYGEGAKAHKIELLQILLSLDSQYSGEILSLAIKNGVPKICEHLRSGKFKLDYVDECGNTLLMIAL